MIPVTVGGEEQPDVGEPESDRLDV